MKRVILGVAAFTVALVAVSSAAGGPANANVTTYRRSARGARSAPTPSGLSGRWMRVLTRELA